MLRARNIADEGGFSVVELLVVVLIIGLLVIAFGFTYQGWRIKYAMERNTKRLFADVSSARARAMSTRRYQFVRFPTAKKDTYYIYDDFYPAPDGDGALQESNDLDPVTKAPAVEVTMDLTNLHMVGVTGFNINPSGLVENDAGVIVQPIHIWVYDSAAAMTLAGQPNTDYNCMAVEATRFNMGLWNSSNRCETK